MLPADHRLRSGEDFKRAVRVGRRSGSTDLVLHLADGNVDKETNHPARVGFVVGKAVGNAVRRNRVKRQLRHLVRDRLDRLPDGSLLVVRALPSAAGSDGRQLAKSLDRCLDRL